MQDLPLNGAVIKSQKSGSAWGFDKFDGLNQMFIVFTCYFIFYFSTWLDNKPDVTAETALVIAREQDVMIRAFDYVVRKNRGGSYQAAVTIGNAMQVISDTMNLKVETGKHFLKSLNRFPANLTNWMKRTFLKKREED